MWTVAAETAGSSTPGNLWTFLAAAAVALVTTSGALLTRRRRAHPDVEPEPVARRVVSGVESYLQKRVKQLEQEAVERERRHHADRVDWERKLDDARAKNVRLIQSLATCQAERADLMFRLRRGDGSDD